MGQAMRAAAKDHPDVEVAVGCDSDPSRAGRTTGVPSDAWSTKGVDGVYIATPPATHAAFAIAALGAGKAVLCEKPLAARGDEGARMVAAAKRSGLANAIHFPL